MRTVVRLTLSAAVAGALAAGSITPALAATNDPKAGRLTAAMKHAMDTEALSYAEYYAYAANAGTNATAANTWATIGDVEYWDHFVAEGKTVDLVSSNTANLSTAIAAESKAIADYRAGAKVARAEGCTKVAATFDEIRKDEQDHHDVFVAARAGLRRGTKIPAAPLVSVEKIVAAKASCTKPGTLKALTASMQSEATSWASYLQWAQKASNTGYPELASLFRAVGQVELQDHFAKEANLSGLVGSVKANLKTSAAAEVEAIATYTRSIAKAKAQHNPALAALLTEIRSDERGHLASLVTLGAR